ncbi:MAG TPA: MFS transporter [Polyangiaceae bacterium]|nr:MFS transporter [Polyangiaceae bacterium]
MSDVPPERASRRYSAWALTWVAYAVYYLGRKGFSVAKKPIEREYHIDRDALGMIDTGHLALYAVGQLLSGMLADRVGARRLVGAGMLLSAACCFGFGSSRTALAMGFFFALNGLAQSTGWPGTTRAMAEWTTPENRRRVMAIWCTCYQFGGLFATALAAALLRFGWQWAFFVPALVMAAIGVLVLSFLPAGPAAPDLERRERSPESHALRAEAVRAALRSKVLYSYGVCYFAIKLIRYSLLFWLPYYLADELGYAPDRAGYVSVAFEVGGILGVVVLGLLTDRLKRVSRPLLASATLLVLASALVTYANVGAWGLVPNVVGLAFIGFCLFGPDSIISGAAAQDAGGPHAAATATGLVNAVGSLGAVLQGALNAWVSRVYGWHAVFYVLIGFALISAVALVPAFRRDGAPLEARPQTAA